MASQVNFTKIRGDFPNGQRGAFEELICQLARREAASPDSFQRIEGSGGDGGVECLHTSDAGTVGYQAKFYTDAADIDWSAIDRSVRTALGLHRDLSRYVVALPCDFTGRRRSRGETISEGTWGIWYDNVQSWQTLTKAQGRHIDFVPWTAAELLARLTPTNADGLRAYWFAEPEFATDWFRTHVEYAIASLDERYSPEDHVNVSLQRLFDAAVRQERWVTRLGERFAALRKATPPQFANVDSPESELLATSQAAVGKVLLFESDLKRPAWQSWNRAECTQAIALARSRISEALDWCRAQLPRLQDETYRLRRVDEALASLDGEVEHVFTTVETRRLALLSGTAGSGKSHLLARVAEMAVEEGRPVVLWLGQQMWNQPLWPQLLQRVGLPLASPEEFLGALDAAAEASRTRALILVDALNEGAGAQLWRSELADFIQRIQQYPSLALVLSCRSEYIDYLVSPVVLKNTPLVEIRGFETFQEQAEAARVYLDKRGISRPATPWLAPEFVNPLFLRSCCNALQREGRHEFPRGLSGTKAILSFYLDSVARHLGVGRDGSDELIGPTKRSLARLAQWMSAQRRNYVPLEEAAKEVALSFEPYTPTDNLLWIDVLRRNGLIRLDPNPDFKPADPLAKPLNVVRFSFQRFQDHLMAEGLLSDTVDVSAAFAVGGPLAFVHDGHGVRWEWRGLIAALSIQVPERFGQELIDVLPGDTHDWWAPHFSQEAFLESISWRAATAFTDRTLQLFNQTLRTADRPLSRLIELAAVVDHPWNADMIHRNLRGRPLPQRDAFWTAPLNIESMDEQHSVHRLVDWCLCPEIRIADKEAVRLCAITLSWLFTATNRPLRDRATKALAHLFLLHPSMFSELLTSFEGVDDLYVWDRIFAAAFGAACIDSTPMRTREYAGLAAKTLFLRGGPVPESILLRDHGRGLIQLAEHLGVVPADIDLEQCKPPYRSRPLRLTATLARVEALSDKSGDKAIKNSCSAWGDFGRYEIESVVRRFTRVPLTAARPVASQGRFHAFEREVVADINERRVAWKKLRSLVASNVVIEFRASTRSKQNGAEMKRRQEGVESAELAFERLLTPPERRRYRRHARNYLGLAPSRGRKDHLRIDVKRSQLWIARRAYELGAAARGFPWSHRSMQPDRGRPHVERLGKKYQWIAFDELLCRLADHYWLSDYGEDGHRYEYPLDLGFLREVDPTIVLKPSPPSPAQWMSTPQIVVEVDEADRLLWPLADERESDLKKLLTRTDGVGRVWLTAYEHQHAGEPRSIDPFQSVALYGCEEFRFVCMVLVRRRDRDQLIQSVDHSRNLDIHSWDPPQITDGPYLLEAPWRKTWPSEMWTSDGPLGRGVPVAFPLSRYTWESHLDLSLQDGHSELLPSPWLMRSLGLSRRRSRCGEYQDPSGVPRMVHGPSGHDGTVALFDREWFDSFLSQESLDCVWVYLNERSSHLGDRRGSWRRTEGIAWIEGATLNTKTWFNDQMRDDDID